jgi:spermidine synthase
MRALILLMFLLSGFAGLTYELIWTKKLSLIFGVTSAAISTVLAAFMGGLALGSAVLGPRADRSRRPLVLYGVLEVLIAASAFCLGYVFDGLNAAHVALARALPQGTWAFVIVRYLLCFAALLVPTALMGGTLPAISRAWVRQRERIGAGVGLLYGVNTMGGVLGTLTAGFLLLGTLGAADTTRVAVMLNLVAGVVCLWLGRAAAEGPAPTEKERARRRPSEDGDERLATFLLWGYALAGATSLAYEVLWTRVLVYFTGQTIYAFSTILASFLIGLAVGSFALARAADKMRDRVGAFGLLELGVGLSAAYLLLVIGRLLPLSVSAGGWAPGGEVGARFVTTFALMLIPTFLMGAVMPVVTRAYARDVGHLGGRLGALYAANTVGCVAGALVGGFVLLAWLGAQRGVLAVAVVNVALGLAALTWSKWKRSAKVAVGVLGLAALTAGLGMSWHPRAPIMYWSDFMHLGLQLLYYEEDSEASVAVLANPAGRRELNLNGDTTAAADYDDIVVHKMLGHVPMLLAERPRTALVIGFGLGVTAWSIWQYPVERIDCIELVPQEKETAEYFSADNGDILGRPRFRFVVGDGRNYLLTTKETYDVISFNAINPSFSPYLYTKEFYELCRRALRPGGVVCAWVPTNMGRFTTLARTFQAVFPNVTLWFCNPFHAILMATPERVQIDLDEWRERMAPPQVRADLEEVQLADPVRLLSTLALDEAALSELTEGAQVNTDDLPYVEFDVEIALPIGLHNVTQIMAVRARPWEKLVGSVTEETRARSERYRAESPALAEAWGTASMPGGSAAAIAQFDDAIRLNPEDPRPRYLRAMAVARAVISDPAAFSEAPARRKAVEALEAGLRPGEMAAERFAARGRAVLGLLYLQEGDLESAREQARLMYRFSPEPIEQLMLRQAVGVQ